MEMTRVLNRGTRMINKLMLLAVVAPMLLVALMASAASAHEYTCSPDAWNPWDSGAVITGGAAAFCNNSGHDKVITGYLRKHRSFQPDIAVASASSQSAAQTFSVKVAGCAGNGTYFSKGYIDGKTDTSGYVGSLTC